MNFKEMYLNGMCPFGYIDSCADSVAEQARYWGERGEVFGLDL